MRFPREHGSGPDAHASPRAHLLHGRLQHVRNALNLEDVEAACQAVRGFLPQQRRLACDLSEAVQASSGGGGPRMSKEGPRSDRPGCEL